MTFKRRLRFKQTQSLTERLHQFADQARDEASRLPECDARKQLLQKIEVTERALQLEGWLSSRELKADAANSLGVPMVHANLFGQHRLTSPAILPDL